MTRIGFFRAIDFELNFQFVIDRKNLVKMKWGKIVKNRRDFELFSSIGKSRENETGQRESFTFGEFFKNSPLRLVKKRKLE